MGVSERAWRNKRQSLERDLKSIVECSPIIEALHVEEGPSQWRALVCFEVPTLVPPRYGNVQVAGPTVVDIRYLARFVNEPPTPWGLVTVLYPRDFYHPNAVPPSLGLPGGLCLGKPEAGISLDAIVHLTYGAITLNSANLVEWEGLNSEAAKFVRAHADSFPLVETGLKETPAPGVHRPLAQHRVEVFAELLRSGVIRCQ